jgi:hypothetical protein
MAGLSGYRLRLSFVSPLGDMTGLVLWFGVAQAFLGRLTRHHCLPYLSFTARLRVSVGFGWIGAGSGVSVGARPIVESPVERASLRMHRAMLGAGLGSLASYAVQHPLLCSFGHVCLTVRLVVFI